MRNSNTMVAQHGGPPEGPTRQLGTPPRVEPPNSICKRSSVSKRTNVAHKARNIGKVCRTLEPHVKAVVRDLGKTKSAKQKAAKEARKIVEMKGKIKDELSLAMIQLLTKLLDEDSVEASTIDGAIRGSD